MKNLKLAVGGGSFVFFLFAMLLANGVVTIFWFGDVVSRESSHVETQLLKYVEIAKKESRRVQAERQLSLISDFEKLGAKCLLWGELTSDWQKTDDACQASLTKMLTESAESEKLIKSITGTVLGDNHFIHIALPLGKRGGQLFGVSISTNSIKSSLLEKQKVIFVYLLTNAVFVSVLFFFRLSRRIFRPLDNLVSVADSYHGPGGIHGLQVKGGGEFGLVSASLQSMLENIENDQQRLEKTIKQLKRANAELESGRVKMIQAEKMAVAGRLAAGVAHEIGNPIGIVTGYLELLKKKDIPWTEKAEFLRRAENELVRVNNLVRQLADCCKPTPLQQHTFYAHPIVNAVADAIKCGKGNEKISFFIKCNAVNDMLFGSPDSLRQVLLNCLLNSTDAVKERCGDSGGAITISTQNEACPSGNSLVVTVSDNGVGLSPQQHRSMFDPFFTTKEPGKGTGLGLAVSHSFVEAMGGEMDFESDGVSGGSMCIRLPLGEE